MQMKTTVVEDILSDLTDVSEKIGPDDTVFIITLFLCRMLSDVCYEDYMTVDENYCGEYVSLLLIKYLCVTCCGS
jgi:hypothetical protein